MWSNGATLWIAENGDGADDATYAYDLKTGERLQDREFELGERNRAPRGGLVRQDDHLDCGQWLGQAVRPSARDG